MKAPFPERHIYCADEKEFAELQQFLFKYGYEWPDSGKQLLKYFGVPLEILNNDYHIRDSSSDDSIPEISAASFMKYWGEKVPLPTTEVVIVAEEPKRNKYSREIKPGVWVDVYDVLRAFTVTDPCLQHLTKKALACGVRGHKDNKTDLMDIKASAERALELFEEWNL